MGKRRKSTVKKRSVAAAAAAASTASTIKNKKSVQKHIYNATHLDGKGNTLQNARMYREKERGWTNNIFVLCIDWDDTLYPTTAVWEYWEQWHEAGIVPVEVGQGLRMLPMQERLQMIRIEQIILKFLKDTMSLSFQQHQQFHPYIVSNSKAPWVTTCCRLFYPELYRMWFETQRIFIMHGWNDLIEDTCTWKVHVFDNILNEFAMKISNNNNNNNNNNIHLQVVNIGDSDDEYKAMKEVFREYKDLVPGSFSIQNIQLVEKPTILQLEHQLEWLVTHSFSIMKLPPHHQSISLRKKGTHYDRTTKRLLQIGLPSIKKMILKKA